MWSDAPGQARRCNCWIISPKEFYTVRLYFSALCRVVLAAGSSIHDRHVDKIANNFDQDDSHLVSESYAYVESGREWMSLLAVTLREFHFPNFPS